MPSALNKLHQRRELLLCLVGRDLRVRYKRSVLGVLWAFAEPLVMMSIFTTVFSYLMRIPVENYAVFVLIGIVVWGYFNTSITAGLESVKANASLVKKIHFPREILPISAILGRTVHFLVSLTLLLPFFVYFEVPVAISWLALPLLVALQFFLACGLGLLFSALATLYEDVSFLVSFALTGLFYLCPVVYPVELVPEHLRTWYLLNPMAALLYAYRQVLLHQQWPDVQVLGCAALVSALVFLLGITVFRRLEWSFAEVL